MLHFLLTMYHILLSMHRIILSSHVPKTKNMKYIYIYIYIIFWIYNITLIICEYIHLQGDPHIVYCKYDGTSVILDTFSSHNSNLGKVNKCLGILTCSSSYDYFTFWGLSVEQFLHAPLPPPKFFPCIYWKIKNPNMWLKKNWERSITIVPQQTWIPL